MRLVEYTAPDGYKHLVWLRDRDPDEDAAALGVPCDPPALDGLELGEDRTRAIHNALVEARLIAPANTAEFKQKLSGVAGDDRLLAIQLARLYRRGAMPAPPPIDYEALVDGLPYTAHQRDCIKRTLAQAGIRDLAALENAPTRVGHICGLDIYLIVAQLLLGREVSE